MWYQGKHLNVAFGFYELMQKATEYNTDFIAFCDQDDVWDEDKLLIAVEKLNSLIVLHFTTVDSDWLMKI